MSEHHTQGRQGQGARHNRRYRSRSNRNHRQRMPRREESRSAKPSLFKRILSFLGFGKKQQPQQAGRKKNKAQDKEKTTPPQRVRVAQTKGSRNAGEAPAKSRRRPASVLPKDQARLYVGNLSFEATEAELEDLFKGFGHVRSVEIIYNSRTYRSKGYAFVEMAQIADAQRAAEVLHGQPFMGRELMVSAASEKAERPEPAAAEPREEAAPAAPKDTPAPEPADKSEEAEVAFGEEIVVNLEPLAPAPAEAEEKAAEAPAAEQPAEAPAEQPAEAPAAEEKAPEAAEEAKA